MLKRAHPGLRETTRVLRILGNQNRVIENFIRDSDTVVGELSATAATSSAGSRRPATPPRSPPPAARRIREGFRRLPTFLARAAARPWPGSRPDRRPAAAARRPPQRRAQPDHLLHPPRPVLAGLAPGAAQPRRGLRGGHPGVPRGHPGDLGAQRARPQGHAHLQAAAPVPPDAGRAQPRDRERPPRDGRGAAGARPDAIGPGDKSGFTGFEALWNYPFWQGAEPSTATTPTATSCALSLIADPDCAPLHTHRPQQPRGQDASSTSAASGSGPTCRASTTPGLHDEPARP